MFLEIPNVLMEDEIQRLRALAQTASFVDGRISNPHNLAKKNTQLDHNAPAYQESAQLLANALRRSEEFGNYAFPKRFAPPLMCRYGQGMSYGPHSDSAFIPLPQQPLRSDLSCTIFIADPASYEGGELTIHLGGKAVPVKGAAGSAVVYPSTTIHEVRPVNSGQRLVAITFIESQVSDERQRELLFSLNEIAALEGYNIRPENRTRLEHVRQSLHRMWAS